MFLGPDMRKILHSVARKCSWRKAAIISMVVMSATFAVLHFKILPHLTATYNQPCYLSAQELDDLRYMIRNVISIYEDMNVTYWLDFGTLLGAVKTGDILRHDGDADISRITPEGGTYNLGEFMKRLSEKGIYSNHVYAWYGNLAIDLYEWELHDGEYNGKPTKMMLRKLTKQKLNTQIFLDKLNEKRYYFPSSWVLPTKKIDFLGMKPRIPKNPERLLKHYYPFSNYMNFSITIPYKWKCWIPFFK